MTNAERNLKNAADDFGNSYRMMCDAISEYEVDSGKSINSLWGFVDNYPFDKDFFTLPIRFWTDQIALSLNPAPFTILHYRYMNTGGNCMVGIHEVWLPEDKRIAYVYTNEEGCNLVAVDYIGNGIEFDDYDEVLLECVQFDTLSHCHKYFELFRRCYNDYIKDDCLHFGYTAEVPYKLLSDDLQRQVDADYLVWLESHGYSDVTTDGFKIIENPYYNDPGDDVSPVNYDECGKQQVVAFKAWHDNVDGPNIFDEDYVLTFLGRSVRIPFNADTYDAVDELLNRTIEDW